MRWLEKNTNIFHQMVLKNGDESHGRSRKKSRTTQTKEERSVAMLHVFANPYASRWKKGLIGFHLPTWINQCFLGGPLKWCISEMGYEKRTFKKLFKWRYPQHLVAKNISYQPGDSSRDLFGMIRWPFKGGVKWPPSRDKKARPLWISYHSKMCWSIPFDPYISLPISCFRIWSWKKKTTTQLTRKKSENRTS